jgi:hypothetical protein
MKKVRITFAMAEAKAIEIDKSLDAYDFQSQDGVYARHEDGTEYKFRCALAYKYGRWLLIFTEHNGRHVLPIDDLDTDSSDGGFYRFKVKMKEIEEWKQSTED